MRNLILLIGAAVLLNSCSAKGDSMGPTTGRLTVQAGGLPDGATTDLHVSGPGSFQATVQAGSTITDLAPGGYAVDADSVLVNEHLYRPAQARRTVQVRASAAATTVRHLFELASGVMQVNVAGLPAGANAQINVSGPEGFTRALTATSTVRTLQPGAYTVSAAQVTHAGQTYAATPATQNATIEASLTAHVVNVSYAVVPGSLSITIGGLPAGSPASVSVTGPNSYARSVTATETIHGLAPGTYTITSSPVTANGQAFTADPATQTASVTAGNTASRTVTYTATAGPSLNLWIEGMYLTQGSQTFAGSMPLVQGRAGLLRVFVRANQANTAQPAVRVRIYHGVTLAQTYTIDAPGSSVPQTVNQTPLGSSWNLQVPASLIVTGMRILADVDPTNAIPESNEGDNSMPANGTPLQPQVRNVPPFRTMLVPVRTSADNLTGNVTEANASGFTEFAWKVYPFSSVERAVHAVYTTTETQPLQSDNANGAWSRVLAEIRTLRLAANDGRHWYGVVRTSYGSGIAGMGYIGSATAIGYDNTTNRGWVAAHEWGHNFGRNHAPCGNAGGADQNYPHAGGRIGVFGYDIDVNALRDTTMADLMGYCNNRWISDYTYNAVLNFRGTLPSVAGADAPVQPTLLVWGRVQDDGQVIIEPSFEVRTRPTLPRPGPHRLELVDAAGSVLESYGFEPEEISEESVRERHFAFTLPLSDATRARLAAVRVRGVVGGAVTRGATAAALLDGGDAEVSSTRIGNAVRVRWNAERYPMLMITDPRTGQVLSLARGGEVVLPAPAGELEVRMSNGVRSRVEGLVVR